MSNETHPADMTDAESEEIAKLVGQIGAHLAAGNMPAFAHDGTAHYRAINRMLRERATRPGLTAEQRQGLKIALASIAFEVAAGEIVRSVEQRDRVIDTIDQMMRGVQK